MAPGAKTPALGLAAAGLGRRGSSPRTCTDEKDRNQEGPVLLHVRTSAAHKPGMNDFELKHPRAAAGTFTTKQQHEAGFTLPKPSLDAAHSLAVQRMHDLALAGGFGQDELDEAARRVTSSMNFTDENIQAIADEVSSEAFGYTATARQQVSELITELRAGGRHEHANTLATLLKSAGAAAPGEPLSAVDPILPVPTNDLRLVNGQVFDTVTHDEVVYHRRREGVYPDEPSFIRVQANLPLTDDDVRQFSQLLGYSYRKNVRGEQLSLPGQDTPFSFVVFADTTKSRRDDLGQAMQEFEEDLPRMILEGSPQRVSQNNTRLVEGFNKPDLSFEIYYDSVSS